MRTLEPDRISLHPQLDSPGTGVIVTGGGSGIGFGCARALAAVGRPVALFGRDTGKLEKAAARLAEEFGVAAFGISVDVGDADALAPAVDQARELLPSLGGLVHCAGGLDYGSLEGITPEVWDVMLNVHARALALLTQEMLPDLQANPGSSVVAIGSINAHRAHFSNPVYSAAKGALVAMVRSLADRLSDDGIRINTVSPGMIRTPMLEPAVEALPPGAFEAGILMGRLGHPDEIGRMVRFLMSDEASYVTAAEFFVDGGNLATQRI